MSSLQQPLKVSVTKADGAIICCQGEWKLVALSAPYRLKRPDRRFEELKNYSTELQTHINNIVKIRTVGTSVGVVVLTFLSS